MAKIFWVDLPDPKRLSNDDSYVNYATVKTKKAALKLLKNDFGMPASVAEFFITEGRDS